MLDRDIVSCFSILESPQSANDTVVVAMAVNSATALIAIFAATVLRSMLVKLNKKLDRGEVVRDVGGDQARKMAEEQGLPPEAAQRGFRFLV